MKKKVYEFSFTLVFNNSLLFVLYCLDSKVQRAHVERPCPKLLAFFFGWQSVVGCPKIKRCAQAPKTQFGQR
jgi:hypothetical protein